MVSPLPRRAFVVAVSLGFLLLTSGVRAQTPWTAPDSEKHRKSAVAAGPKVVEQGKKVAQVNCASCHGNTGKGNGPAAMAPCRPGSISRRTTGGRSCSTSDHSRSSAALVGRRSRSITLPSSAC